MAKSKANGKTVPESSKEKARRLLLTLWDKAVGTKGYNKEEWIDLQELIDKASF